jgi:hypothetical protein
MSTTIATATNGYMIRLELLKMAKEMLEQDWHASRETALRQWEQEVNLVQNRAHASDQLVESVPAQPTFRSFPTEEEIIKKAKVLNEFINTK